jgi:hypothetical protein
MAQRVLAENAGVESVRYVLPNKHYIPVDMKYIGVDNTNPYVLETFSIAFSSRRLFQLWKTSSASCCGAEDDGGWFFSSIGCRPIRPQSLLIYHAVRASELTHFPFQNFLFLIPDGMRRFSPQWTRQGERQRGVATGRVK